MATQQLFDGLGMTAFASSRQKRDSIPSRATLLAKGRRRSSQGLMKLSAAFSINSSSDRRERSRNSDSQSDDSLTDLDGCDSEEKLESFIEFAQRIYRTSCSALGILPCRLFSAQLRGEEVVVRAASLGPVEVKAMSEPLIILTSIVYLDLTDNCIGGEGAGLLARMIKENVSLKSIILANNKMGSLGAAAFSEVLALNIELHHLDLSGNGFRDCDAKVISDALAANYKLKLLNLSHNQFGEAGGRSLAAAIAANDSLEDLDLSWNHLRLKGAVAIGDAIKDNRGLIRLNLAMNGFGNDGAFAVGKSLENNSSLSHLDISSNRINIEGAILFCKGLKGNDTLQFLSLAGNPLTTTGAAHLLYTIKSTRASGITHLDIRDVLVTYDFGALYLEIVKERPNFTVMHGGYVRSDDAYALKFAQPYQSDPFLLLMSYLRDKQLRIFDVFCLFDADKSLSISKAEFVKGLTSVGIPLTNDQLQALITVMDKDKNGVIDYSELVQCYNNHIKLLRTMQAREKARPVSGACSRIHLLPSIVTTASSSAAPSQSPNKANYNTMNLRFLGYDAFSSFSKYAQSRDFVKRLGAERTKLSGNCSPLLSPIPTPILESKAGSLASSSRPMSPANTLSLPASEQLKQSEGFLAASDGYSSLQLQESDDFSCPPHWRSLTSQHPLSGSRSPTFLTGSRLSDNPYDQSEARGEIERRQLFMPQKIQMHGRLMNSESILDQHTMRMTTERIGGSALKQ